MDAKKVMPFLHCRAVWARWKNCEVWVDARSGMHLKPSLCSIRGIFHDLRTLVDGLLDRQMVRQQAPTTFSGRQQSWEHSTQFGCRLVSG